MMAEMVRPLLAVTLGDPSGVGPEVVAKAIAQGGVREGADIVVVGSARILQRAFTAIGAKEGTVVLGAAEVGRGVPGGSAVGVIDVGVEAEYPAGVVNAEAGRAAHGWVETAARLCLDGSVDAMVTAPVNKAAFALAGIADTGHQEILKRLSGAGHVATMLVTGPLRCMHLSTHKPLREACAYVTRTNVLEAIRLTDRYFREWGFARPRIAVAALNPHASDDGLIGREELDEIGPAVAGARAEGIGAAGPIPADSVFNQAIAGKYDVVVVMYHDQGHIAIKVHGFERSVSVNLGLPFIRTSVDHGTAFDIAGRGVAGATSMVEAIKLAGALANGRGLVPAA